MVSAAKLIMFGSKGDSDSSKALSLTKCCVEVFLLDPPSELSESELELLDSEDSDALEDDEYRRENLVRLFLPLCFFLGRTLPFFGMFSLSHRMVCRIYSFSRCFHRCFYARTISRRVFRSHLNRVPSWACSISHYQRDYWDKRTFFKQFFYERRKVNCIR